MAPLSSIWWHRWCHHAIVVAVDAVVVVVVTWRQRRRHRFGGIGSATVPSLMWGRGGGGGGDAASLSLIWWHWCHRAVVAVDAAVVVTWRCRHRRHFGGIGGATVPSLLPLTWGRSGGGDAASSLLSI